MNFDMHMHSTFSDGKDDVETLIDNVKKAGIDFFSITDHDTALSARTILNSPSLKQKIKSLGLNYVVGTEWSCIYNDIEMHILAYDFDPFLPEVASLEKEIAEKIKEKDKFRMKYIADAGFKFSDKSLKFLQSRENVRKLDLANCLVDDGYFDNIDLAIQQFLNKFKYDKDKENLSAQKVIETLSKCGAKMVWAHSIHGLRKKPLSFEKIDEVLFDLKRFGLAGLECFYSLYNKDEISKLLQLADKHGLFVTAGSDYHGSNKMVALAETSSDGTPVDLNVLKLDKIFKNVIK